MLIKKRTKVFGLSVYAIVVPFIIYILMISAPKKTFQLINSGKNDSIQAEISLFLPIDKKNSFLLESGYGERLHPVFGVMRLHTGIDLVAKEGVPVVATQDGIVTKARLAEAWGNIIIIQHDNKYSTSYSHLKSMHVKVGDKVQQGQEIGFVGHTGPSSKDHLHFELIKNGKAIDPMRYLPEIK